MPEENYYKSNPRVRPQTAKYNSRQNMSSNKVDSHDYTSKINEQAGINPHPMSVEDYEASINKIKSLKSIFNPPGVNMKPTRKIVRK